MTFAVTILLFAVQASAPEPIVVEKPKLICRDMEQETGSHIRGGRRCETADDWAREEAQKRANPTTMRLTEGQGDALTKQRPQ